MYVLHDDVVGMAVLDILPYFFQLTYGILVSFLDSVQDAFDKQRKIS